MQLIKSGSETINHTQDASDRDVENLNTTSEHKQLPELGTVGAKVERVISQNISPSFDKMNCDDVNGSSLYENVMVMGNANRNEPSSIGNDFSMISSKNTISNNEKTNDTLHAANNSITQKQVAFSPSKNTSPSYKMVIFECRVKIYRFLI